MIKFLSTALKKMLLKLDNAEHQLEVVEEIKKRTKQDFETEHTLQATIVAKTKKADKRQTKAEKTPKQSKQQSEKKLEKHSLISHQQSKFFSLVSEIGLDPDKARANFMARQLVQATLPHKNPGNVEAWSRKNGNLTLTMRPGWNSKKEKSIGYPYGTLPRLLLFWITTEAVRTNSPCITLGDNLSKFMEKLGLDASRGGKRSDAKRLKEQMIRLFRATISFEYSINGRDSWIDMQVAPKGMLCWDERYPDKDALWESHIQLGEDFFNAITSSPVPVDVRALKALKNSPLALDLYAWATYTAYQTQRTGKERSISWKNLHEQFGSEYSTVKNFSAKAWKSFLRVQFAYPHLNIERVPGGIKILPSNPSVVITNKKTTTPSSKTLRR